MAGISDPGVPFKDRLRRLRERAGLSRPVLGGLVGRSGEWVKALEGGRLLTPRLPLLLRLAEVLGVDDLAELTGDERLTTASYTKAAHEQLSDVAQALATYPMVIGDGPADVDGVISRVRQMWELWHGTHRHRTAIAGLIPDILQDARRAVRRADGNDRRAALAAEAQVYHLTQLFLSNQPASEQVWLSGDRAMTAAQDADSPYAMAAAVWYLNHVFRDAGQQHEARVQLALDAIRLLDFERSEEDRALWGLLYLAIALSHAKMGREGDAWHYWDHADYAASALGDQYTHPWLMFGRGIVDGYAVDILNDLMKPGDAVQRADRLDLSLVPSATRRSRHTIQIARAFYLNREPVATVHLLRKAEDEAPETIKFDPFTRGALIDLAENGGTVVREEARMLAQRIGIQPA
ncbi:MAG: helix-turn-helix transcriptional regulator [Actinophytocola sp.]|uniref:helix-turn-helix domain-containing protein n=1 Tax=Actinophytocola sp. TaxID=1872138 RepID=UPI003C7431E8